jgi:hypothetical protein
VWTEQFMTTKVDMFDYYDEEPPSKVSMDPSCSRNNFDGEDDWVIVKKQRVTILIPPPSPDAANPQTDMSITSTKQCRLTRSSEKGHPESIAHKGIPKMVAEISPHSPAGPVAKSELTKVVRGPSHQYTGKVTSSVGSMDKPRMPVVSSHVMDKIMRARLLERRVAGLGGLKNWLFDCGLGWFIDILDSENLGMYQLVSLTMNQLKEMGLVAVGPRRKLIHAIDSLSQPHQFEMVS